MYISIHNLCHFLADLFDILLPMLNIYQEYVRNHQYSLQVLANCKQNRDFDKLLKQYESNAACEGRMLETFLTYPMFQVHIIGSIWLGFFLGFFFYILNLTIKSHCVPDSSIYHHAAWTACPYSPWACRTQEFGFCQVKTGGAVQVRKILFQHDG